MMTDPVADMLTRIRNAALARHDRTEVPASKMKQAVAEILKSEGYIADVRPSDGNPAKLTIVLKYGRDRSSALDGVRRVSRPGRRVYVKHDRIPRVLSGLGISILSTSHGLMSDRDARKNKLGGELICEVW
ncbi:MAG TPA: 30S ribosomal protein S8 [Polyangium sp.]|uniref:Small ribosomal subunit protein uS8 n=2 Tax=Polyangium TaxID=55 RepID=A0A4U1IS04_9BACT|nr:MULTISPECIES: 30S ribosomal protein S8 [Polyangium]MDI1436136.1 30S ribosomal protein S8 [Polyangium sorediatum]TKC97078.1 30S ribosomal protein S8 [Polyangium fumosum]HVK66133.1 30S ribosomal protein S8 [Polyangium sp.]